MLVLPARVVTMQPYLPQRTTTAAQRPPFDWARRSRQWFAIRIQVSVQVSLLARSYVDLFTVEYSRLRKAIDKDPGVEVLPPSAAEAGVDRDILDDLRQQLQTAKDALSQAQEDVPSVST